MFVEPVFGKKFFGREDVLATLKKRVTALKGGYRQNLALAGPMLAGKSSILRHFLKNIDDPEVIPLYIEMTGEDFAAFSERFMGSLLFHYLRASGIKPEGELKELKKVCRSMIPETVTCMDGVSKAIKEKKNNVAYETLLGMTSVFKTETGKSCLVILDEFHNLADFNLKKPFQTFGKFIMVQKNTMYIVSSSQKTLLKEILSKKLSLLFGNFEILDVDGFDNQTSRTFVSEKMPDVDYGNDIVGYIVQVSQGSPFYLEVLSGRFNELFRSREGGDAGECLLEAFASLLYSPEGILNQYFSNNINFFLEKRSRKSFIPILVSLACGNSTIKALQNDMGRVDRDLSRKLQKLQEMDLVFKSGVFYKITDKLFEYWLKYVYSLKSRSMVDDLDIKYLEFKKLLADDLRSYGEFASKDVVERICDLFRSFRNEKVRIRMNERKLPAFDSVSCEGISPHLSRLTCVIGDKEWICHVVRNDMAAEADISGLIEDSPRDGARKAVRRVIIPLKGVEQNAFLLAKDRNIWVWDLRLLNGIFRLYKNHELVL